MAQVTLKAERPSLTVNVGEEQYKLPLTFTRSEYEEMAKAEDGTAIFVFFRKYLGDVMDMLGDDDIVTLTQAWSEARKEIGAPAPGEA